jgi:RND family efflux transporter MFP subunit
VRPLVLALAGLALAGCVNRAQQEQAKRTEKIVKDPTVPVQTTMAVRGDMPETIAVTGSIRARQEVGVGAQAAGRVVAVYVRDGDSVASGQAIAQIDSVAASARLRQAVAQESQARAQLRQAETDARATPQRSQAAVQAAQARLNQARARLLLLQKGAREEDRVQAEWGVRRAKSDLDTAEKNRDRTRRLAVEGVVPMVEAERADNAYENALAAYNAALQTLATVQNFSRPEEVSAAREEVRAAEAALALERTNRMTDSSALDRVQQARAALQAAAEQTSLARKDIADATVRAPFSGRVSGRPLEVGSVVGPGTVVATLVGGAEMYFEGQVPSSRVGKIAVGSPVTITVQGQAGTKYRGQVAAIDPSASGIGRVFTMRATLGEGAGLLKSGMFATGEVLARIRSGVTLVPAGAVLLDGESASVFVQEGGKARRVQVKVGLSRDGRTEVSGLPAGAEVVTAGQRNLVDGTPIRVEAYKTGGKG